MNLNLDLSEQTTGSGLMDGLSVFCYQQKLDIKEVIKLEKNNSVVARLSDDSLIECTITSPGIINVAKTTEHRQLNYRLTKDCLTWTSALIHARPVNSR